MINLAPNHVYLFRLAHKIVIIHVRIFFSWKCHFVSCIIWSLWLFIQMLQHSGEVTVIRKRVMLLDYCGIEVLVLQNENMLNSSKCTGGFNFLDKSAWSHWIWTAESFSGLCLIPCLVEMEIRFLTDFVKNWVNGVIGML